MSCHPAAAIRRFNKDLNAVPAEREVAERMATIGPIADASMGVDQVAGFLRSEHRRWGEFTKEINVLPE